MPIVPKGGLILVTGANGYIAGVTIQTFLDAGYLVRGTVRDPAKYDWMLSHYGPNFSLVGIPDLAAPGAYDEAIKGVDGIAHIASPVVFLPDPQAVIPGAIAGAIGILEAAAKEPSVKSVCYTSSKAACIGLECKGKEYKVDTSSWNEGSKAAWTAPVTQDFLRAAINYMCAKTESEQRSWKWIEENKPQFTFNTVVPNVTFGTTANPEKTGFISSSGMLKLTWDGRPDQAAALISPEWFVDNEDLGLLHLAALTQPDVQKERILGFGGKWSYNEILSILRKKVPEKKFVDDIEEVEDYGTVENGRSVELLKRYGKEGFTSLEDSVSKFILQAQQAEKEDWKVAPTAAAQVVSQFAGDK